MSECEYRLARMPAQASIGRFNEQMATLVAEGWDPIMMSGDATVNIMMRRAVAGSKTTDGRQAAAGQPAGAPDSSST